MTKQEFLKKLHNELRGLPPQEIDERLTFYREMIDDRMEDGLSEEEAVAAVETQQVTAEPICEAKKEKKSILTMLLLILGSPIWLPLGSAALAVLVSVYAALWSGLIALWASYGAIAACAMAFIITGSAISIGGEGVSGAVLIGAGLVCAGVSVFFFCGCKYLTAAVLFATKKTVLWVKNRFTRREAPQ